MVPERKDGAPFTRPPSSRKGPGKQLGEIISLSNAEPSETLESLRANDARFRALLSSLDDLVLELDEEGDYRSVWTTAEDLLIAPPNELLKMSSREALGEELSLRYRRTVRRALETGQPQVIEYQLEVQAGVRWFQARVAPIRSVTGDRTVCALVRDITDRKLVEEERDEAERHLRHQVLHDDLTGLPNRPFFFDRLAHALERAKRRSEPLAVLMLDLDGFKQVNDSFGHAVGDGVLKQVATRLESATRDSDSIARLGGDEFAVLLPATTRNSARTVVERLSGSLHEPVGWNEQSFRLNASIGVAYYPKDGTDADSLLRSADVAMYRAKRRRSRSDAS